jgi:glycosyltransferase involved in cell wall biosynthesis
VEADAVTAVSVVVPTYNSSEVLPRAIESVLSQSLDDLELIVVDDASTDRTDTVVSRYDDPRLRYVRHETNRGGSAARNTGIEHACGTYVAFLDADDEWHPEKLERQVECLESRSEDWVAAYCDFERVRRGPTRQLRQLLSTFAAPEENSGAEGGEELVDRSLLLDGFSTGGMSTLIVERTVVEAMGGFDESFRRRQDWEFRNRLTRRGKLAYVDEVLVTKHQTENPPAETVEESALHYLETFSDDVRRLERRGYPVTGRHLFHVATSHYAEGNFRRGTRFLRQSHVHSVHQCLELGYCLASGVRASARRLSRRARRVGTRSTNLP